MNVDSVGFTNSQIRGYEKLKKEQEPQEVVEPKVEEVDEEESSGDDGGQRGVIRNLMEGHYKGVSDVRLRINFHEEIMAIENQQLQAASAENAGSVTQSVNSLVESGKLTQEQADEAIEGFQTAAEKVLEDFASNQPGSTEDLVSALNSIFDKLVEFLQSSQVSEVPEPEQLITEELPPEKPPVDPTEPPVTETPPEPVEPLLVELPLDPLLIEDPIEPQSPPEPQEPTEFELFLGELAGLFNASVEGFIKSINSVSVLPTLSEPNGNGAAYEKFVEIYNDMIGSPSSGGEPEGEIIDALG
jgi:hypothetical protein